MWCRYIGQGDPMWDFHVAEMEQSRMLDEYDRQERREAPLQEQQEEAQEEEEKG